MQINPDWPEPIIDAMKQWRDIDLPRAIAGEPLEPLGVEAGSSAVDLSDVASAVMEAFGINRAQLEGLSRMPKFQYSRWAFALVARRETGETLDDIGAFINRAPSSAGQSIKFAEAHILSNAAFAEKVSDVKALLSNQQIRREASA